MVPPDTSTAAIANKQPPALLASKPMHRLCGLAQQLVPDLRSKTAG